MKFRFDKPTCQNIRKSLRKEWIETNGLGDYASSSLICCNTRKYHGLLVADLKARRGGMYCCRLLRNRCSWAGGNCVFPAVSIPASFIRAGMSILRKWTPENGRCSVTVSER